MEQTIDFQSALDRCRHLASKSETCSADVAEKLRRWCLSSEQSAEIIGNLISEKFIDDQRFAIAYVKDKTRFNHWGRIKTTAMLRQKQINQGIINKAFDELDPQVYLSVFESEMEKKERSLKKIAVFERRQKVANYLLSKGFESDLIFDRIKEII
jgi:regulatory protein